MTLGKPQSVVGEPEEPRGDQQLLSGGLPELLRVSCRFTVLSWFMGRVFQRRLVHCQDRPTPAS